MHRVILFAVRHPLAILLFLYPDTSRYRRGMDGEVILTERLSGSFRQLEFVARGQVGICMKIAFCLPGESFETLMERVKVARSRLVDPGLRGEGHL